MMNIIPYILLAVVAGSCLPTQAGINARLNIWAQSPILAAAISFAVGTISLMIYALVLRIPIPETASLSRYPWWMWTGGFLGAFFVASTVVLAPRLGAASMVSLIIAGQMMASLILDHFGLIGYESHPLSLWRCLGVVFIVGGVVLIRVF